MAWLAGHPYRTRTAGVVAAIVDVVGEGQAGLLAMVRFVGTVVLMLMRFRVVLFRQTARGFEVVFAVSEGG